MAINLEGLKARLLEERERLGLELDRQAVLQSYGEGIRAEDSGYGTHMADDAPETYEKERRLSLEMNLRNHVEGISRALHRMEKGDYGECVSCHLPIAEERLEALPDASNCYSCAERQDRHKPS